MIDFHSPLNFAFVGIGIGATIAGFLFIAPAMDLPIHWGLDGQIDAMLPRNWALLQMPAVVAAIWGIFYAIDRYGNSERSQASTHVLNVALSSVTGIMVLIQTLVVLLGLGVPIDMIRSITVALALMQVALGNVLPKSRPNAFAGLRIPTTLNDEGNWHATHRVTGILMIVSGVALFLTALVVPASVTLLLAVILSFVAPISIGTLYSFVYAARAHRNA